MQRVQIEHQDFMRTLTNYDSADTLFYCDPPYASSTRSGGVYRHDFNDTDQQRLIQALLQVQGMVLLSGYKAPVHTPLEKAGWQRLDYHTSCYAAGRTQRNGIQGVGSARALQPRLESVWICPRAQSRVPSSNKQ